MPFIKYIPPQKFCTSPEHLPPSHIVLEPGTHIYQCPSCFATITFDVLDTTMHHIKDTDRFHKWKDTLAEWENTPVKPSQPTVQIKFSQAVLPIEGEKIESLVRDLLSDNDYKGNIHSTITGNDTRFGN
ncbi:MAG: hypothetical protein AABY22_18945 [Nanoarchaeota archaeon]